MELMRETSRCYASTSLAAAAFRRCAPLTLAAICCVRAALIPPSRGPNWLTDLATVFALALAGFCIVLASIAQLAEALLP
ncbi:hypothetical protein ABZ819_11390 [Streptomyces venezuelae]|uniref:hypothetical protein n=1 Tax=Streptomyces venezuelae TaxID=54571 RepID=UPI00343781B7